MSVGARRLVAPRAWELAVIPSFVYMAGGNVDIIGQYAFYRRSRQLSTLEEIDATEHRAEVAVSYTFDVPLYGTVNIPRDLVNADYNYVPVN